MDAEPKQKASTVSNPNEHKLDLQSKYNYIFDRLWFVMSTKFRCYSSGESLHTSNVQLRSSSFPPLVFFLITYNSAIRYIMIPFKLVIHSNLVMEDTILPFCRSLDQLYSPFLPLLIDIALLHIWVNTRWRFSSKDPAISPFGDTHMDIERVGGSRIHP